MRTRLMLGLVLILLLAAAVVVVATASAGDSSAGSAAEVPSSDSGSASEVDQPGIDLSSAEDVALTNRIGVSVREDSQQSRPIGEQAAVEKARAAVSELIQSASAPVRVVARRVLLTQDGVPGGPITGGSLRNRPVWIVTISGVEIRRIGVNPSGVEKLSPDDLKPHTEVNVVVDSETGEPLMQFHYR